MQGIHEDEETVAGSKEGRIRVIQRQQETDPEFWALFESHLDKDDAVDVNSAMGILLRVE